MPHLELIHSRNLEAEADLAALCAALAQVMRDEPMFETGGIRVRAIACDYFVIADGHPRNAFLDMSLRIGTGRSAEAKRAAGEAIFACAQNLLRPLLDQPHFALSFEIREIDPALSWKTNSIHPRLRGMTTEK